MPTLSLQIPSQGWRQMMTARKELLDNYDRARDQSAAHKVQTYHGIAGEAWVRKWLSEFLPQRYGVTAGYVISSGLPATAKAPHFDVVLYDQLESPVLWVEDTPDRSPGGRARAIPVEHTYCVLEVKAALSARNVTSAIEHLSELKPLMDGFDAPNERYRFHLPPSFHCGLLFFELRATDAATEVPLNALKAGAALRGFFGGMVLRGEGHTEPLTGRLGLTTSAAPLEGTVGPGKENLLAPLPLGSTTPQADGSHLGTIVMWAEFAFAQFAFDILAMIRGEYDVGRLSSFYGLGSAGQERRAAPTTPKASGSG